MDERSFPNAKLRDALLIAYKAFADLAGKGSLFVITWMALGTFTWFRGVRVAEITTSGCSTIDVSVWDSDGDGAANAGTANSMKAARAGALGSERNMNAPLDSDTGRRE